MDEVEAQRLKLVAERDADADEDGWRERFSPGTHGCHEALHTASVALDLVDRHLLDHGAIIQRPEWFNLAERASQALFDLYQAIGSVHLDRSSEDDA